MAPEKRVPATIEQLEQELADLKARREALLREKQIFWRLGFSTDRLRVLLRQVDAQQERCEVALRELRKAERARASFAGREPEYKSQPAS